jgi:hypothetical protein
MAAAARYSLPRKRKRERGRARRAERNCDSHCAPPRRLHLVHVSSRKPAAGRSGGAPGTARTRRATRRPASRHTTVRRKHRELTTRAPLSRSVTLLTFGFRESGSRTRNARELPAKRQTRQCNQLFTSPRRLPQHFPFFRATRQCPATETRPQSQGSAHPLLNRLLEPCRTPRAGHSRTLRSSFPH